MKRSVRLLILLGGIVLGQFILYAPSLLGLKILLPLDILTARNVYLPQTPERQATPINNLHLVDMVYLSEPARMYVARQVADGRLPSWVPYQYAGSPLLAPVFSPVLSWQHWVLSPLAVAWTQVWAALVGGVGAFLFWRRSLKVGYLAAAVAAWCYPLTAFFIFWQGYYLAGTAYFLPWMLLAVDAVVQRRSRFAVPGLAVATGATLVSGTLDIAGQVLLISGAYAVWRLISEWWQERRAPSPVTSPSPFPLSGRLACVARLTGGWMLGFMLAAHWVLPVVEYARTGTRIITRAEGREERPPQGISALPQVVLPDMYGAFGILKTGSFRITADVQQESSAAGYAGLAATLLIAPLAWCDRRRRPLCWFLAGLVVFSLGWCLNLPGIVQLLRLPVMNMMSHNRFVFGTAFALLTLAALGLDALRNNVVEWRKWMWAPSAALAALLSYCAYRALNLPEPIATGLEQSVREGKVVGWLRNVESVYQVQDWFIAQYSAGALFAALCLAGWLAIRKTAGRPAADLAPHQNRFFVAAGVFMLLDLLWFGYGRNVQSSPELYYPRVPALAELAAAKPGRVTGAGCLPANLSVVSGLEDVRGYDGADPFEYVQLLVLTADSFQPVFYAITQWQSPKRVLLGDQIRLSPVLDLLGVTHVIFRGSPPSDVKPAFQSPDYWVMRNPNALPRVFVPSRVEVEPEVRPRLSKLGSPDFDPRSTCYVEKAMPELAGVARGQAELENRTPTRVMVSLRMETPGMVVLTDRWDKGWRATLNGQPMQIHRVNHALRGVAVPAGTGTLEFFYRASSRVWGMAAAAIAVLVVLGWTAVQLVWRRQADHERQS